MTHDDDIRDLLRRLTPDPQVVIDVEQVRRGAQRRRASIAAVAAIAVAVVLGSTVAATTLLGGGAAPGPTAPATSPGDALVSEDCPEPIPDLEIATVGSLADFVFVEDREFERQKSAGSPTLGAEVAKVTCTIADQSPEHDRPAYAFWHEGNAGYLPLGAPLREVVGHDPRCRVAAVVDGETSVYATELEAAGDCRPEAGTGCPESRLLPEGTVKLENWADIVRWSARTYRPLFGPDKTRTDVPLGAQVGLVTCNIQSLTDELDRDRDVTGPLLSGNATYLPVGTKLFQVGDYGDGCRIAAVLNGEVKEYLATREDRDEPVPCATDNPTDPGVRVSVPSHCGVLSVTIDGQLWLADPPLGDHNPPAGWDENQTPGRFVQTGPRRAEFHGDAGQTAMFRLAPAGATDPNSGCE